MSTPTEFDKELDEALTLFQSNLASAYRSFSPNDEFSVVLKEEATKIIKQAVDKYVINVEEPDVRSYSGKPLAYLSETRQRQRQSLWGKK